MARLAKGTTWVKGALILVTAVCTASNGGKSLAAAMTPCVGDCQATGTVAVNSLITLVNIALGNAQPSSCPQGIPNGGDVTVALIIQAVNNALNGCPGQPATPTTSQPAATKTFTLTPTNTFTPTPTVSLHTGSTTLVSINSAGTGGGNSGSIGPVISADGRFVAFYSSATDLVPGLQNTKGAIFVRDLQTGTTSMASVNSAGTDTGNFGVSLSQVISANGRIVAFYSDSTDLVGSISDLNAATDLFAYDVQTGITKLVSIDLNGTGSGLSGSQIPSNSLYPALSVDGRFVAFQSTAANLVSIPDPDRQSDIFVRDLQTDTTTLVSINSAGTAAGNLPSCCPSISADGRFVAFEGIATDLAGSGFNTGAPSRGPNAFVRDLQSGVTTLVDVTTTGAALFIPQGGLFPVISPNGRFVAFVTDATGLVSSTADTNNASDVFVRDLQAATTMLVSVNAAGTAAGNRKSEHPVFSADGRFIAFESIATDLVAGMATPGNRNIFVRDLEAGTTVLASINSSGTGTAGGTSSFPLVVGPSTVFPAFSADGRFLTFQNDVADLIPGIRLSAPNVFVRDLQAGTTTLVSVNKAGTGGGDKVSDAPVISSDGHFVAFESNATNLVPTFTPNGTSNVYRFAVSP